MHLITWLDTKGYEGSWLSIEEAREYAPVLMETVGWIIRNEETYVVVVSSKDDEGLVGSLSAIPKGVIQSMKPISDI